MIEQGTSIKRVYGANPENLARIQEHYRGVISSQGEVLNQFGINSELEKTNEETGIIEALDQSTNDKLSYFGLSPITISPEHVHIIAPDDLPEDTAAFYSQFHQTIVIGRFGFNIPFIKSLYHEMIHFKAYNAVRVNEEEGKILQYRTGFTIDSPKKRYFFGLINEAVTEELSRQFILRNLDHPLIKSEYDWMVDDLSSQQIQKNGSVPEDLFDGEGIYIPKTFRFKDQQELVGYETFSNVTGRKALTSLISTIDSKNTGAFGDPSEVFDLFVNAIFTGHMYELGKLIDRSFGRGTFRKIGEIQDPDELLEFVKSLGLF